MAIRLCQNCQRPYGADLVHDDEYCKTVDPIMAKKAVEERYAAMTAARERRRKERDARLPDKAEGGTCKDCHASLNNTDPDDHRCREYDKDESGLVRELGRTDARTQIWK